jgi:hypothetical protein
MGWETQAPDRSKYMHNLHCTETTEREQTMLTFHEHADLTADLAASQCSTVFRFGETSLAVREVRIEDVLICTFSLEVELHSAEIA